MPMTNDGDIVKGLGYTTLYAAYMEEAVDECRIVLMKRDPAPPKGIEKWPISRRVEYVQERLTQFAPLPQELAGLPSYLDYIRDLLERRNEVIHGRIYGSLQGEKDELRPGRPTGSARPITSAELYDLANEMFATLGALNHASTFAIPRLP
ncbi:MAG: hypothetical protein KJ740_23315 [Gammaproteobacteria bacterium]|nr:hypothetical protein [Gammaproteobacteria bacterium]